MKKVSLLGLLCLAAAGVSHASIANVYYAATSAGSNNGTSCANAYAFNDATNGWTAAGKWGAGGTQIGPDTIIHACGTFTDTTGGNTLFQFLGSGTSGHPITLKFETGASFTNTNYWPPNGGIYGVSCSFLVIDGGTNGLLQATGNGDLLANQQASNGIQFNTCHDVTVKNMTVANIFVSVPGTHHGGTAGGIGGIAFNVVAANDILQNDTVHDAGSCLYIANNNGDVESGMQIINSEAYHCNWNIVFNSQSIGGEMVNGLIQGNNAHDDANWDDLDDSAHHNGIHLVSSATNGIVGTVINNNWVHGDFGLNNTGLIYTDVGFNGNQIQSVVITNNLLAQESSMYHGINNGYITDSGTNTVMVNNTMYASANTQAGDCVDPAVGAIFKNNICANQFVAVRMDGNAVASMDYNNYYNINQGWTTTNSCACINFAAWKAATGFDSHSVTTNPVLNTGSTPPFQLTNNTSAAWQTGINLFGNPSQANTDYVGTGRPGSSPPNWDMGAYYNSGGTQAATPAISPSSGSVTSPVTVTMTCSSPSPTIYYTVDGTTPTTGSTVYSSPFMQTVGPTGTTVKAMCTSSGLANSGIATVIYSLPGAGGGSIGPGGTVNTGKFSWNGSLSKTLALTFNSGFGNVAVSIPVQVNIACSCDTASACACSVQ